MRINNLFASVKKGIMAKPILFGRIEQGDKCQNHTSTAQCASGICPRRIPCQRPFYPSGGMHSMVRHGH